MEKSMKKQLTIMGLLVAMGIASVSPEVHAANPPVGWAVNAIGTLTIQSNANVHLLADLSIGRLTNAVGHGLVAGGLLSVTNDYIWVGRHGTGDGIARHHGTGVGGLHDVLRLRR